MKRTFAVLGFLLLSMAVSYTQRPFNFDDMMLVRRVSDPQLSPDGKTVAFVIGDVDSVLAQSRSLLLDPLYGHSDELLHVERPEFRETVKELAQLDGAFVVRDDGTFVSAGRYSKFKEFEAPRTYDFAVYGSDRGTIERSASGSTVSRSPC